MRVGEKTIVMRIRQIKYQLFTPVAARRVI